MSTTPYRDTIPREAPGCTCKPAPTPRTPIPWARVGGVLLLAGGLGLLADLFSMFVLTLESGHSVPESTRWIAAGCAVVMATGCTLALTAEGKAFPHL